MTLYHPVINPSSLPPTPKKTFPPYGARLIFLAAPGPSAGRAVAGRTPVGILLFPFASGPGPADSLARLSFTRSPPPITADLGRVSFSGNDFSSFLVSFCFLLSVNGRTRWQARAAAPAASQLNRVDLRCELQGTKRLFRARRFGVDVDEHQGFAVSS